MRKPHTSYDAYDIRRRLEESAERGDVRLHEWMKKKRLAIGGCILDTLHIPSPRVNETFRLGGRGGGKRFIVFRRIGSGVWSVATSGGEDGSIFRFDILDVGGIELLRLKPVWTSKQAKARYDQYVDLMRTVGNESQIVPFSTVEELRPAEEEASVPEDDADPVVVIRHTAQDGTIAEFARNAQIFSILKRFGFVWVPSAKVVRRTQSIGLPKTTAPLESIKSTLNQAGFSVAFDIERATTREQIEAAHTRRREYLQQRAEMMRERSEKAAQRATAYARQTGEMSASALSKLDIAGYYPTPPEIVAQVIQEADIGSDDLVLEPSAGSGALADAARAMGADVDVVESHPALVDYLASLGYPVVSRDILTFAPGALYDAIVMNPPFEDGKDAMHVRHAFRLLKPGGRLVALMSEGPFFRERKADVAFRAWLDTTEHHTEKIPAAQFGRTKIATRLVVIDKREDDEVAPEDAAQIAEIARARASAEGQAGRASEIAESLTRRASTSRRAQRSLERAKEKAKEQTSYAAMLSQRARAIEAKAAQVGAAPVPKIKRSKPARDTTSMKEQVRTLIRSRIKRDTGATLLRTDSRGWAVGFGEVQETWHGKQAERELWLSLSSDEVAAYDSYSAALRSYGRSTPLVSVSFEGKDAETAYSDFVRALRGRMTAA